MSDLEKHTLGAIAESAQSAARRARLGDLDGAEGALARAERHLEELSRARPPHARVVRLAREAVRSARGVVEIAKAPEPQVTRREAESQLRSVERAAARAKAS